MAPSVFTPCAACTVLIRVTPLHTYTSPFRAPEYVRSSLAAETHRMVCRSPVFPKTPLFGVKAFPQRVQNYAQDTTVSLSLITTFTQYKNKLMGKIIIFSQNKVTHTVGLSLHFLSHLDVFDSAANQTAGLEWVPCHVKDLQDIKHMLSFCGQEPGGAGQTQSPYSV